jgi:hypothetical protein
MEVAHISETERRACRKVTINTILVSDATDPVSASITVDVAAGEHRATGFVAVHGLQFSVEGDNGVLQYR